MENGNYGEVIGRKGFLPYLFTQVLGAFNDHTFKIVVSMLAVETARRAGRTSEDLPLIGALFVLPYLFFSGYSGWTSDVYNKRKVIIAVKSYELLAMSIGAFAMWMQSMPLMMAVVFMMGLHATFFSPAKSGIVPEMMPLRDLCRANGLVDMSSFLAIVTGTMAGSVLSGVWGSAPWKVGVLLMGVAVAGIFTSFRIAKVPDSGATKPFNWNPWGEIATGLRRVASDRPLLRTIVGTACFWFIGAFLQMAILAIASEELHADEIHTGLLIAALAVGIGAGSMAAGRLSGDKVELGLLPLGSGLMGVSALLLGFAVPVYWLSVVALGALGFGAGLYIVPLDAFVQHRAGRQEKGCILSTSNFCNTAAAIVASGVLLVFHAQMHVLTSHLIAVCGGLMLVGTIYVLTLVPHFLVRFVLWFLTHTIYRMRIIGRENIPQRGGALLVCNHVSYVDGLLVGACIHRFVRFLVIERHYQQFRPILERLYAIPVQQGSPRALARMIQQARKELSEGRVVCIFPEGNITHTGNLLPFMRGMEKILKGVDVPVIPVHLDGVWGSIFSFQGGKFLGKLPLQIPYPVTISFGAPMPSSVKAPEARQAVQELGSAAAAWRLQKAGQLQTRFIGAAKRYGKRLAMADSIGKRLSYREALIAGLILARRIRAGCKGEEMVGVLLPASVGGALSNIGIMLAGKAPVNINFTAGAEAMASVTAQCKLRTTLTSKVFLAKAKLAEAEGMVFVEDLLGGMGTLEKFVCGAQAMCLPSWLLQRMYRTRGGADALGTVLFSSGSTGEPKGVMLSHGNVLANLDAVSQVFPVTQEDCIAGVLPFFHSFGFNFTLWFPLTRGMAAVYHASPAEGKAVGELVQKHRASLLLATPTFCGAYTRSCTAEQFASLKYVLVGAEKLREATADAFQSKFGELLYEGYGCTEMAPVVSVNSPDIAHDGETQIARRPGSVGRPLPGVSARVVDPETFEPVATGSEGLVLVWGPNRMRGYLNQPEKTKEVLHEEWYVTGDIGFVDTDGFLHLTDRLSRFSKIAGEMVPHLRIEEALLQAVGGGDCAITSIPDEQRGERLVGLYTHTGLTPDQVWKQMATSGLPKLWMPKPDCVHFVEKIPVSGTGKRDLRAIKAIAVQMQEVSA